MTRLDRHLVATGLAESRARAQALIAAGAVTVDGVVARKAARQVGPRARVAVTADPCPWVSRAALKLTHALDEFGLTPHGVALDVGASTGGFTEVLLARGAVLVFPGASASATWLDPATFCSAERSSPLHARSAPVAIQAVN